MLGRARGNHTQAAQWMQQIGANVPLAARAAREVPGEHGAYNKLYQTKCIADSNPALTYNLQGYGQRVLTAMIWMHALLMLALLPHSSVPSTSNASEIQSWSPQGKRKLLITRLAGHYTSIYSSQALSLLSFGFHSGFQVTSQSWCHITSMKDLCVEALVQVRAALHRKVASTGQLQVPCHRAKDDQTHHPHTQRDFAQVHGRMG